MTLDSVLTIVGLFLAGYSVMPRVKRLSLKIGIAYGDIIFWAILFAIIHYLLFHPLFAAYGFTPYMGLTKLEITPQRVAYIVSLVFILHAGWRLGNARLQPRYIARFRDLAEELLRTGAMSELLELIERNLHILEACYVGTTLSQRYTAWVREKYDGVFDIWGQVLKTPTDGIVGSVFIFTLKFLPRDGERRRGAADTVRSVLLNSDFISSLVNFRPYLGLKLLKAFESSPFFIEEFRHDYFGFLIKRSSSVLFEELKNNEISAKCFGYEIPPQNKLLYFLFSDISKAESLGIYKPIGDVMIHELQRSFRDPATDIYNLPYDQTVHSLPLYRAVHFFQIMLTEALRQNWKYHMWMFYYVYWAKEIVKNIKFDGPGIEIHKEFPNCYLYIIYCMLDGLRDLVLATRCVPLDQENCMPELAKGIQGGGIIGSAIMVMCQMVGVISESQLPEDKKAYFVEIVFCLYFEILKDEDTPLKRYNDLFKDILMSGGHLSAMATHNYKLNIIKFFESDAVHRYNDEHVRNIKEELASW